MIVVAEDIHPLLVPEMSSGCDMIQLYGRATGRRTLRRTGCIGTHILLGVTVFEELDLAVDCLRGQLVPNVETREQPCFAFEWVGHHS